MRFELQHLRKRDEAAAGRSTRPPAGGTWYPAFGSPSEAELIREERRWMATTELRRDPAVQAKIAKFEALKRRADAFRAEEGERVVREDARRREEAARKQRSEAARGAQEEAEEDERARERKAEAKRKKARSRRKRASRRGRAEALGEDIPESSSRRQAREERAAEGGPRDETPAAEKHGEDGAAHGPCTHDGWWEREEGHFKCGCCKKTLRLFAFRCSGCHQMACGDCMRTLKKGKGKK